MGDEFVGSDEEEGEESDDDDNSDEDGSDDDDDEVPVVLTYSSIIFAIPRRKTKERSSQLKLSWFCFFSATCREEIKEITEEAKERRVRNLNISVQEIMLRISFYMKRNHKVISQYINRAFKNKKLLVKHNFGLPRTKTAYIWLRALWFLTIVTLTGN